jgi:hypothetical protein
MNIYERLRSAIFNLEPHTKVFKDSLIQELWELGIERQTPGEYLNTLIKKDAIL